MALGLEIVMAKDTTALWDFPIPARPDAQPDLLDPMPPPDRPAADLLARAAATLEKSAGPPQGHPLSWISRRRLRLRRASAR
jgi:hypothetical protein